MSKKGESKGARLKVLIFSVIAIASFTLFVELFIPDVKGPAKSKGTGAVVDAGRLGTKELIRLGREIYFGDGACALCHDATGGRAPSLRDARAWAEARISEASYKGSAKSASEYIIESMNYPSIYIVEGYGTEGFSTMPASRVAISDTEMRAIAEFLLSSYGVSK